VTDRTSTRGLLPKLNRALMPLEDLANLLAALAIFLLMVPGVAQIGMRSIFGAPIAGCIDMVELSMASTAFLEAAYCQRLGAHIRMELLVGRLHGAARRHIALQAHSIARAKPASVWRHNRQLFFPERPETPKC